MMHHQEIWSWSRTGAMLDPLSRWMIAKYTLLPKSYKDSFIESLWRAIVDNKWRHWIYVMHHDLKELSTISLNTSYEGYQRILWDLVGREILVIFFNGSRHLQDKTRRLSSEEFGCNWTYRQFALDNVWILYWRILVITVCNSRE